MVQEKTWSLRRSMVLVECMLDCPESVKDWPSLARFIVGRLSLLDVSSLNALDCSGSPLSTIFTGISCSSTYFGLLKRYNISILSVEEGIQPLDLLVCSRELHSVLCESFVSELEMTLDEMNVRIDRLCGRDKGMRLGMDAEDSESEEDGEEEEIAMDVEHVGESEERVEEMEEIEEIEENEEIEHAEETEEIEEESEIAEEVEEQQEVEEQVQEEKDTEDETETAPEEPSIPTTKRSRSTPKPATPVAKSTRSKRGSITEDSAETTTTGTKRKPSSSPTKRTTRRSTRLKR